MTTFCFCLYLWKKFKHFTIAFIRDFQQVFISIADLTDTETVLIDLKYFTDVEIGVVERRAFWKIKSTFIFLCPNPWFEN